MRRRSEKKSVHCKKIVFLWFILIIYFYSGMSNYRNMKYKLILLRSIALSISCKTNTLTESCLAGRELTVIVVCRTHPSQLGGEKLQWVQFKALTYRFGDGTDLDISTANGSSSYLTDPISWTCPKIGGGLNRLMTIIITLETLDDLLCLQLGNTVIIINGCRLRERFVMQISNSQRSLSTSKVHYKYL